MTFKSLVMSTQLSSRLKDLLADRFESSPDKPKTCDFCDIALKFLVDNGDGLDKKESIFL